MPCYLAVEVFGEPGVFECAARGRGLWTAEQRLAWAEQIGAELVLFTWLEQPEAEAAPLGMAQAEPLADQVVRLQADAKELRRLLAGERAAGVALLSFFADLTALMVEHRRWLGVSFVLAYGRQLTIYRVRLEAMERTAIAEKLHGWAEQIKGAPGGRPQ